ncbi:MAG: LCP family protein [Oscillospiraceae bacterium]
MANRQNGQRNINTNNARTNAHTTNPYAKGYKGENRNVAQQSKRGSAYTASKRKRNTGRTVLFTIIAVLLVIVIALGGLYMWVSSSIGKGIQGSLDTAIGTAPEFKGDVLNVLVLGIDYEEGRNYGSGMGMTDMIMYVNFDVKNSKINMLQIPRDMFVGSDLPTGGTGKINALYYHGKDKENPVSNIANVIHEQLSLPIDAYLTIDMDSLKEMVDRFGGIEVEVPHRIAYGGSVLEEGTRLLSGTEVEFFVRNRKGEGYANSDLDRLVMQRNFYKGMFNRIRTATAGDIMKLMPCFMEYFNTDIPLTDCIGLAIKLLNIKNEDILMAKLPVYAAAEKFNGNAIVVGANEPAAQLLNDYFRGEAESIATIGLADFPHKEALYEADVQFMAPRTETPTSDTVPKA